VPGESDPSRAPCQVLQSYLKPSHGVGPRFIEGPIHALQNISAICILSRDIAQFGLPFILMLLYHSDRQAAVFKALKHA